MIYKTFTTLIIMACLLFSSHAQHIQYRVSEFTFTSQSSYTNPFDYEEVEFKADFSGPQGESITIYGFWDGGSTWKVRFTPLSSGTWTYTTTCSNTLDRGLHNKSGSLTAGNAVGPQKVYLHGGFLKPSANGKYLTYTDGTPFLYIADVPWPLPSSRIPYDNTGNGPKGWVNTALRNERPGWDSPVTEFLNLRESQRYTAINGRFTFGMWGGGPSVHETVDNNSPDDILYWQSMDATIDLIAEKDFIYFTGILNAAWVNTEPIEKIRNIWRYILARYGAYPTTYYFCQEYNWHGNPKRPNYLNSTQTEAKVLEIGGLISQWDSYKRALGLHSRTEDGTQQWLSEWDLPWVKFVLHQMRHKNTSLRYDLIEEIENHPGKKIAQFLQEWYWEGFYTDSPSSTDETQRKGAYSSINSGCPGFGYGANGIFSLDDGTYSARGNWGPPIDWWEALDAYPGQTQMQHVLDIYSEVNWWEMVPRPNAISGASDLYTKSIGQETHYIYYSANASVSGSAKLSGVRPSGAEYSVRWFNVRNGSSTNGPNVTVATDNRLLLPSRPNNNDWLLVLKNVGQGSTDVTWNFDNGTDGWGSPRNISNFRANNGNLEGNMSGEDPYFLSATDLGYATSTYKIVEIRMRNSTPLTNGRVHFTTINDESFGGNSIDFTMVANDPGYTTYELDMSAHADWTGTLTRLRVDPGDFRNTGFSVQGSFSIDYIKLKTEGGLPDPIPDEDITWNFSSSTEGWGNPRNISNFRAINGNLEGTMSGEDPYFLSATGLGYPTSTYRYVEIKLQNSTPLTNGRVLFTTTNDGSFNGNGVNFTMVSNDNDFTIYEIDMSTHADWTGNIDRLRLDPGDFRNSDISVQGGFSIDYIKLKSESGGNNPGNTGSFAEGTYYLKNKDSGGRLRPQNNNAGVEVQLGSATGTTDDYKWIVTEAEPGYYFIENLASGLKIRPDDCAISTKQKIETHNGTGECVRWVIQEVNGDVGHYYLFNQNAINDGVTNLGMRNADCNDAEGTMIETWNGTGNCVRWSFEEASGGGQSQARVGLLSESVNPGSDVVQIKVLQIYPNPVSTAFIIQNEGPAAEVTVRDLTGKMVKQFKIGENSTEIQVTDWNKGIYLISVKNNEMNILKRIVVN